MKQFRYHTTERGMAIQKTFCADTKKEASELLDVSLYTINTYCSYFDPKDEECIKNPRQMFAYFDSGEATYAFPGFRNKILSFIELQRMISNHRKKFYSYKETQDYVQYGKMPTHTF